MYTFFFSIGRSPRPSCRYRFPDNTPPWPPYTIWDFFPPAFNCPWEVERIGILGDGGKFVCGFSRIVEKPKCVIYSIGVNHESSFVPHRPPAVDHAVNPPCSFEAELLERGKNCQVWGYDFSVDSVSHFLFGQSEANLLTPSLHTVWSRDNARPCTSRPLPPLCIGWRGSCPRQGCSKGLPRGRKYANPRHIDEAEWPRLYRHSQGPLQPLIRSLHSPLPPWPPTDSSPQLTGRYRGLGIRHPLCTSQTIFLPALVTFWSAAARNSRLDSRLPSLPQVVDGAGRGGSSPLLDRAQPYLRQL